MKILNFKTLGAVTLGLFLQNAAIAATVDINNLFSTGVNAGGTPLNGGSPDTHYNAFDPNGAAFTPFTVQSGVFPLNGAWVANTMSSAWIGPNTTSAAGITGIYKYITTFTLPGDTALSSVVIAGAWAADNGDTVLDRIILNGTPVVIGNPGFSALTPFTLSNLPSVFQLGSNTLQFEVNNAFFNGTNPTGLQVQFTQKNYTTPAPSLNSVTALTLMMLGLVAWTFSYQRRKI